MKTKKLTSNGQTYYGNLVHDPDNSKYYVEIWQLDIPGEIYTGSHSTAQGAWDEAKSIIFMEASVK